MYSYDFKQMEKDFSLYGWELAFFNFVDHYRKHEEDISQAPSLPEKELSLFQGVLSSLLEEKNIDFDQWPEWVQSPIWLKDPWFVSGVEGLKAMAILESPFWFRRNNIWVLSNFLSRV